MICDDLAVQASEWIEQVDHYLAECTIYDEGVRERLTKVRDAIEDLRAHIETGELRDYLDSM